MMVDWVRSPTISILTPQFHNPIQLCSLILPTHIMSPWPHHLPLLHSTINAVFEFKSHFSHINPQPNSPPSHLQTHQKTNKKIPLSWESAIPNILTNSNTHNKIKCKKQIPQPNQTLKTYLIYIPLFVNPPKPSKKCWGFCLVQLKKKKTLLTLYQLVSFLLFSFLVIIFPHAIV